MHTAGERQWGQRLQLPHNPAAWLDDIAVQLTTTERLARYETAQEVIGMMIALCSTWIEQELAKARPDRDLTATWEAERSQLTGQRHGLTLADDAAIDRVLAEYGPIVKAAYAA
jgi:hypothetical protein